MSKPILETLKTIVISVEYFYKILIPVRNRYHTHLFNLLSYAFRHPLHSPGNLRASGLSRRTGGDYPECRIRARCHGIYADGGREESHLPDPRDGTGRHHHRHISAHFPHEGSDRQAPGARNRLRLHQLDHFAPGTTRYPGGHPLSRRASHQVRLHRPGTPPQRRISECYFKSENRSHCHRRSPLYQPMGA